MVGNGQIVRGQGAGEERKAEVAEINFASQRGGSLFFNGGPELVDRDKERRDEDENDQDDNDDEYDAKCTAHEQPPARQGRQRERERVVVRGNISIGPVQYFLPAKLYAKPTTTALAR